MTNIPFSTQEAQFWKPHRVEYSSRYRSALRVDPLLAGDRISIEIALRAAGYPLTLEGTRQYLRDWCDVMKPEYMMASTPHDFTFPEGTLAGLKNEGINEEAMKEPGASQLLLPWPAHRLSVVCVRPMPTNRPVSFPSRVTFSFKCS
jgi:hypothetical protein